jgi:hypothetical protein
MMNEKRRIASMTEMQHLQFVAGAAGKILASDDPGARLRRSGIKQKAKNEVSENGLIRLGQLLLRFFSSNACDQNAVR